MVKDTIGAFKNNSYYYIYAEPPANSPIYNVTSGICVSPSVGANRYLLCGYITNTNNIVPYFSNDLSDFGPGLDNFTTIDNALNYQLGALPMLLEKKEDNSIISKGVKTAPPGYSMIENDLEIKSMLGTLTGPCHPYVSSSDNFHYNFRMNNGVSGFLDYSGPSLFKVSNPSFIDSKFTSYKTHGLSLSGSGSSIGFSVSDEYISFGVSNLTTLTGSFYRSLDISSLETLQTGVLEITQGTSIQYMIYEYHGGNDQVFYVRNSSSFTGSSNGTSILNQSYFGISEGQNIDIKIALRNHSSNFKSYSVEGIKFYLQPHDDLLFRDSINELRTVDSITSFDIEFYNRFAQSPNPSLSSLSHLVTNLIDRQDSEAFTSDLSSISNDNISKIVSHPTLCEQNVTDGTPDCHLKGNAKDGDMFIRSKNGEKSEIILITVDVIFIIFFIVIIAFLIKMYGEGN